MPEMIRIAHVALQLETGGMERLLAEFARHADRSRFEAEFVAIGVAGRIAGDIEAAGSRVTALNARPGVRPSIIFHLARLFRERRIDIVHAHNTKPLLYAGPAAKLAEVRGVAYTRHGQRRGATRRQNALYRLASRCADRIICVSKDSMRCCLREGVDPRSIHTIWNGIDLERFNWAGVTSGGPALFVGRLTPEKDVATLLHAASIVAARDRSFRLLVAGDGPCAADLRDLAASLNLGRHVQFLGEARDVRPLLNGASMFVLPSVSEGLPLTVLEAMACGLPVVATDVGGTPEAVEDGRTGLLVPPRSPSPLAEAILRLRGDEASAREMGREGRWRAEASFDVRGMVSRYESLYEDMLHRRATALAA